MIRIREPGFTALGAPLGNPTFINMFALKLVAQTQIDPTNMTLIDLAIPAINLFDEQVDKSLPSIINCTVNFYTQLEISQPMRYGGLGILSAGYI